MKISMDKLTGYYSNIQNTRKPAAKENLCKPSGRNFDEIMIRTSSRQAEESQFIDRVSSNLMSNVTTKTPESRILQLKHQVEVGTYKVDSAAIASSMLLQRGELINA